MNTGALVLALLLSGPLLAVAAAQASPESGSASQDDKRGPFLGGFLRETRVIYPLRHDGWEAQGEHLYDVQELGASVRYAHKRHPDRWIDLYFYPAGVLDAKQFGEAMAQERRMLEAAVQPGGYTGMNLGETKTFTYRVRDADGRKGEEAQGYSLDLHAIRDGRRLNSAMTLQLEKLYFIKARMSVSEGELSRPAARELLEDFVRGLVDRTTIASTGGCWMPLPIEAWVPQATLQPHLLSMGKDGKDNVVVTRDKVLAVDPASPEAHVAMMLGMSMTGRLVDGCQPMEEINHAVKDGMRELRLEYHAADAESQGQSPRLRPERTGRG